jgi:hypothetical protein
MKLKILRSTVADGKAVDAGEEVEVSESAARVLINLGKAVLAKPKPERVRKDVD